MNYNSQTALYIVNDSNIQFTYHQNYKLGTPELTFCGHSKNLLELWQVGDSHNFLRDHLYIAYKINDEITLRKNYTNSLQRAIYEITPPQDL